MTGESNNEVEDIKKRIKRIYKPEVATAIFKVIWWLCDNYVTNGHAPDCLYSKEQMELHFYREPISGFEDIHDEDADERRMNYDRILAVGWHEHCQYNK